MGMGSFGGQPVPSSAFSRTPACSWDIHVPTSSPTPIGVHIPQRRREGKKRTVLGEEQPSPRLSLPLVGYCSQMETVKPCQPLQFGLSRWLLTYMLLVQGLLEAHTHTQKEKTTWSSSTKSTDLSSVLEIQTSKGNLLSL